VEETAPFMFFRSSARAVRDSECVSADAVTIACRGRKSAQELELMRWPAKQPAMVFFRAVFASLKDGMSQENRQAGEPRGFSNGFARRSAGSAGPSAALRTVRSSRKN